MAERERVEVPSPALLKDIQDVVRWFRTRGKRPTVGASADPLKDQYFAPETYVALTPAAGIAGLGTLTGTGSPAAMNSAECRIYRAGSTGVLEPYARRHTVWNVTEAEIPGDTYVVVTRHKEKEWLVITETSGVQSLIAKVPIDQVIEAADPMCATGTGTGLGGLIANPVECLVHRLNGYRLEPVEGLYKLVRNPHAEEIPACSIVGIKRDAYGDWWVDWWSVDEDAADVVGTGTETSYYYTCVNRRLHKINSETGDTISVSDNDCCDDGDATGTDASYFTCADLADSTILLSNGRFTIPGNGDPLCLPEYEDLAGNLVDICAPCETIDCGGFSGARWVGGAGGATFTVQVCNCIWQLHIAIPALNFSSAGSEVTNGVPCSLPSFFAPGFNISTGHNVFVSYDISLVPACNDWRCYVSSADFSNLCADADPGAPYTEVSGPYESEEDCNAVCQSWFCWSADGSEPAKDQDYRYCSQTDDDATASQVSGPYATEELCINDCHIYYCVEFFRCDGPDLDCTVNCEHSEDISPNPSCGTSAIIDCQYLVGGETHFTIYGVIIAEYGSFEECQINCVEP